MKKTKQLLVLLLAVMLVTVSVVPAMAITSYTPIHLSVTTLDLKEILSITEAGAQNPSVTYKLTLGDIQVYSSGGITYGDANKVDGSADVNGKELASVTYTAGEIMGRNSKEKPYAYTGDILDKINAMMFERPGIYYWPITKTKTGSDTKLTNFNRASVSNYGTALVIRIDDVSGILTPTIGINVLEAVNTLGSNKNTVYEDNYPAKPGTLTIKKEVTGNQGAKDQYFQFDVTLSGMKEHAGAKITIDAVEGNSVAGATLKYNEFTGTRNNTTGSPVEIDSAGRAVFTFWLKDGEQIKLENIPTGPNTNPTHYQIVETITGSNTTGYTTTYVATTGSDVINGSGLDTGVKDLSDTDSTRVVFKNDKASTVPTGIILQVAAPVAGIVLALALLAVVMLSKKRSAARR